MPAFILFSRHEVGSDPSQYPTAVGIESALQSIPIVANRESRRAMGLRDNGGWVGNARITRRAYLAVGLNSGRITQVGWLYSWPVGTGTPEQETRANQTIVDYIRTFANQHLREMDLRMAGADPADSNATSRWSPVEIIPYNPAIHGSEQWWASGEASRTATRDGFDLNQQTGETSTVDNPTGPTTIRPPSFDPLGTQNPQGTVRTIARTVTTVGLIALGILALIYLGPAIRTATASTGALLSRRRPALPARTNPRRKKLPPSRSRQDAIDAAIYFSKIPPGDNRFVTNHPGHIYILLADAMPVGARWFINATTVVRRTAGQWMLDGNPYDLDDAVRELVLNWSTRT